MGSATTIRTPRVTRGDRYADVLTYCLYALIAVVFGGPLLWIVSLSFQTLQALFAYPPRLIPNPFTLANYEAVLGHGRVFMFIQNSLKISVLATIGVLCVTIPAAYAVSRFRIRGKRTLMLLVLVFQMISPLIISIPLYRYFGRLGLLNSHFGAILVYVAVLVPFITWVLRAFFDSIPISLEEAAMIDGCSRVETLFRIILPIAAPGIASAFVLSFLLSWSQFIVPFILLNDTQLLPLAVGILNLQAQGARDIQLVATAGVLATVPPVLMFIILQRQIVRVLTAGAVKE